MSAQSLPKNNGNNGHSAQRRVIVCAGTGCVASGSYKVFQALVEQVRAAGLPVVAFQIEGTARITESADFQANLTMSQRNLLAATFTDLDSDISSAQSAQENGDYEGANTYYNKASAGLSTLKSAFASGNPIAPTPQPVAIDFTLVLIIVLVIVAAVAAFIFIRRRGAGGSDELEEELGEDFGPLPGEEPPSQ